MEWETKTNKTNKYTKMASKILHLRFISRLKVQLTLLLREMMIGYDECENVYSYLNA